MLITKKNQETYDNYYFGFDNDDDHYKVSGPQYAKAVVKKNIKDYTTVSDDEKFYIAIKEPSSYEKFQQDCDEADQYFENPPDNVDRDKLIEQNNNYTYYQYCEDEVSLDDLDSLIYYPTYKDTNKGKMPPKIRKHHFADTRKEAKSIWKHHNFDSVLYEFALMSLIIQIVAIVVWAVGRFIGGFGGGGNDQKSPSEGEA